MPTANAWNRTGWRRSTANSRSGEKRIPKNKSQQLLDAALFKARSEAALLKLRVAIEKHGFGENLVCNVEIRTVSTSGRVRFAIKHPATGTISAFGAFSDAEARELGIALLAEVERMRSEMTGNRRAA